MFTVNQNVTDGFFSYVVVSVDGLWVNCRTSWNSVHRVLGSQLRANE
jgi:hypothetical protein